MAWLITLLCGLPILRKLRYDLPAYLVFTFVGCAVLEPLLLIFVFPASITRWFVVFPFGLMGAAIVLSKVERSRMMILAIAAPLLAGEVLGLGFYFNGLFSQWSRRSPDRFDVVAQRVNSNDRILAEGQFWLSLSKTPHHLTVIYPVLGATTEWLLQDGCDRIARYDVVILSESDPYFVPLSAEARKGRTDWSSHAGGQVIHLYRGAARNPIDSGEAKNATCP